MTERITQEFIKYQRVIGSLLRKIRPAASAQDIEDILQDTFINTYQSSKKQEIRFPKAFMVKTAIRLANRHIKLAARTENTDGIEDYSDEALYKYDAVSICSSVEKAVLDREDFGFLCGAVEGLPPQCRRVFILKKIYGLSQREIADRLGISQSTVEKHVAKGLMLASQAYQQSRERIADNQPACAEQGSAKNRREQK